MSLNSVGVTKDYWFVFYILDFKLTWSGDTNSPSTSGGGTELGGPSYCFNSYSGIPDQFKTQFVNVGTVLIRRYVSDLHTPALQSVTVSECSALHVATRRRGEAHLLQLLVYARHLLGGRQLLLAAQHFHLAESRLHLLGARLPQVNKHYTNIPCDQ